MNKSQGTNHGVRVEGHHNASDAEVGNGQRDNEQVRDVLQGSLLSINFIIAIQTIIIIITILPLFIIVTFDVNMKDELLIVNIFLGKLP